MARHGRCSELQSKLPRCAARPSAGGAQAQLKALAQRRAQLRQKRSSDRNRGELDNQALQAVHKQAAELLHAFVAPAAAAHWAGAGVAGGRGPVACLLVATCM